jgi:hypothetical protein
MWGKVGVIEDAYPTLKNEKAGRIGVLLLTKLSQPKPDSVFQTC